MSKETNFFDQIELYLTDQLSESERSQFESQLQQDPLLKEEFTLQEDIISSIKSLRRAELKTRLDNIDITPAVTSGAAGGLKVAGSILATAAIGVGTYFYLSQPNPEPVAKQEQQETIEVEEPVSPTLNQEEITDMVPEQREDQPEPKPTQGSEIGSVNQDITEVLEAEPQAKTSNNRATEVVQPNLIEVPEDDEMVSPEESIDLTSRTTAQEDISIPQLAVIRRNDGKHNFHYQYFNDKLYLYGDFQDIPYEILDWSGADERKLYLFYKDNFYDIESDRIEITPLELLTDQSLVEELKALRESKNP